MAVQLIDCTHNPDLKVAVAALTSITGRPPSEIYSHLHNNGFWEEDRKKLIGVLESGHLDILEHATFTFSLNDISRLASFALVRHRIPTFTQVSQRYTSVDSNSIFIPKSIRENSRAERIFSNFAEKTFAFYHDARGAGIKKEDARYGLCIATKTHLMVTSNLREFLYIIRSNLESVPQEVADISSEMLSCIKEKAPLCSHLLEGVKESSLCGEYVERRSMGKANRYSSQNSFKHDEFERTENEMRKKKGVMVLDCTDDPLSTIAKATLGNYTGRSVFDFSHEDAEKIAEELKDTIDFPHEFEYAHVTVLYEESLASAHQDIRHRMRTMSIQPMGSVIERGEAVVPPSLRGTPLEGRLGDLLSFSKQTYHSLIEEGIPAFDACYVALNAAKAHITSDFDFRNLLKAISLRCCLRAQWEIREIYDAMLRKMIACAPEIFHDAGPGCRRVTGCPEGNLICETPRGKYFPHEIYMKKYPDSRLTQKLKETKA